MDLLSPSWFVLACALVPVRAQVAVPRLEVQLTGTAVQVAAVVPPGDLVAIVAAIGDTSTTFPFGELLANHVVLGLATSGVPFTIPVAAALAAAAGVHVQGVLLAADGTIAPGLIVPVELPWPSTPIRPDEQLADIGLQLIGLDVVPPLHVLLTHFLAPSDGYGLHADAIVRHPDGTDVYLRLDTPGPGEGDLDIVEHHHLAIELGASPGQIRVLAAAGPQVVPAAAKFRKLGVFDPGP